MRATVQRRSGMSGLLSGHEIKLPQVRNQSPLMPFIAAEAPENFLEWLLLLRNDLSKCIFVTKEDEILRAAKKAPRRRSAFVATLNVDIK